LRFSGEKLKELRGKRTQHDLAEALRRRGYGTTQTQVSRWEAGQAPRGYIVDALAEELGCSRDDLFVDRDEPLSRQRAIEQLEAIRHALVSETLA